MAGYGYSYRGYSAYGSPQSEDLSKTRPAIFDAEGRRRPVISSTPYQNLEPTRTVEQHLGLPLASEYRYGTQIAIVPVDEYGARDDDRMRRKEARWNQTDYPKPVDEFLNKVQTEASRPRFEPLHPSYWRQTPAYTGNQSSTGGYTEYPDMSNTGWKNPNGNAYRNEKYDTYYQKNGSTMDPTMIASGGWTRPSHSPWTTPTDASLSRPTSDIGTAMALLQEAARPAALAGLTPRYAEAVYNEIIDTKEAAKRYGKLNFVPRPYDAEDKYATTIDSREATRKYRGTIV